MEIANQTSKAAYVKPAVKSYSEQELLLAIEAWGSGGAVIPYGDSA